MEIVLGIGLATSLVVAIALWSRSARRGRGPEGPHSNELYLDGDPGLGRPGDGDGGGGAAADKPDGGDGGGGD